MFDLFGNPIALAYLMTILAKKENSKKANE